jgi:hypothetical protein
VDEYIVEFPLDDTLQDRRRALEKLMVDAMQAYIPDVRVAVESTLMPRWYKEAKAIYDDDAKTIMAIWTPEEAQRRDAVKKAAELAAKEAEETQSQQLVESIHEFHTLIEDELPTLADSPTQNQ